MPNGVKAFNLSQPLQPFRTFTGQAQSPDLGHLFLQSPHFTYTSYTSHDRYDKPDKASTVNNYSTGHLFSIQFWVLVGSTHTHIRTIHRLQTSLRLHLFPAPPAYYQAGAGGASSWTHAATVEARWSERHAYPVTVRWLCSYAWCIRKKMIYLLLLMDIWAFAQCQRDRHT